MPEASSYKTVQGSAEAEIVEKKSRFIAHIEHVESEDDARDFINRIREGNKQARHNVYAYLLKSGRTRYSDDGEPAQTSGLPTFESIEHAGLADVAIVTTRYFGGILLGTGGLVRAYTSAANAAIKLAHIVEVTMCIDISFDIPYDLNSAIQKAIFESKASVIACNYTDRVSYILRTHANDAEPLRASIIETTRGKAKITLSDPYNAVL